VGGGDWLMLLSYSNASLAETSNKAALKSCMLAGVRNTLGGSTFSPDCRGTWSTRHLLTVGPYSSTVQSGMQ